MHFVVVLKGTEQKIRRVPKESAHDFFLSFPPREEKLALSPSLSRTLRGSLSLSLSLGLTLATDSSVRCSKSSTKVGRELGRFEVGVCVSMVRRSSRIQAASAAVEAKHTNDTNDTNDDDEAHLGDREKPKNKTPRKKKRNGGVTHVEENEQRVHARKRRKETPTMPEQTTNDVQKEQQVATRKKKARTRRRKRGRGVDAERNEDGGGAFFLPLRALGLVTSSGAAPCLSWAGRRAYVTTSNGAGWQCYDVTRNKPRLVLAATQQQQQQRQRYSAQKATRAMITAMAVIKPGVTAVALGEDVYVYVRAHAVAVLKAAAAMTTTTAAVTRRDVNDGRMMTARVVQLVPLGKKAMIVLMSDARLLVFDTESVLRRIKTLKSGGGGGGGGVHHGGGSSVSDYTMGQKHRGTATVKPDGIVEADPDREFGVLGGKRPSCVMHPPTYVNKVVVGGRSTKLQLWNMSSGELVHTLHSSPDEGVVSLEAAPALDVVAAGTESGNVVLINLRRDAVLFTLGCGPGAALSMSFTRAGAPRLAVGSARGGISVWDLETRRRTCNLPDAHQGEELRCIEYIEDARGTTLLSCGCDNAIRTWRVERASSATNRGISSGIGANVGGSGERLTLLCERSGHVRAPIHVRFCGDRTVLSAGGAGGTNAMRVDSVIQEHRGVALSQKGLGTGDHLAPVHGTAICTLRSKDWCDAITCHEGRRSAVTWRLSHARMGENDLVPPGGAAVTAVALSACGNFALVGTGTGAVHRFNMQSGLYRGEYKVSTPAGSAVRRVGKDKHVLAIEALGVDGGNRHMLSACAGGLAGVWDFKTRKPVSFLRLGSPVSRSSMHGVSGLAALALAGTVSAFSLVVVDVGAARVVRRLVGHKDRITSLAWSPDARLLLSSGMDASIRIWDVPAARCVQVMHTSPPATSIALSPSADLMASTHVGCRGVYIWRNMRLFGDAAADADRDTAAPSYMVDLPHVRADARDGDDGDVDVDDNGTPPPPTTTPHGVGADDIASYGGDMSGVHSDENGLYVDNSEIEDGDSEDGRDGSDDDVGDEQWANGWHAAGGDGDLTLSTVAEDTIQAMLQPELVRARNKPIDAPKKPEAAPFFLPTAPSLGGHVQFQVPATDTHDNGDGEESKESGKLSATTTTGTTTTTLRSGLGSLSSIVEAVTGTGTPLAEHVSALIALVRSSPATVLDAELTLVGLGLDDTLAETHLASLLSLVGSALAHGSDTDLMHGFLAMLLSSHAETIARSVELRALADDLHTHVQRAMCNLGDVVAEVRNMLDLIQAR